MANDEVPPTFWKTLPPQIRSLHRRGIKVVRTIFLPALYRDNHRDTEEEGTLDVFGQGLGLDFSTLLYDHPMTVIIIANIWRATAFSMLIYQAALNDISNDVVEAGKLDGANAVRIFFSIKMPIIRRSILTNLMLTTLQTLSVFSLIIILTGGGPGNQLEHTTRLGLRSGVQVLQAGVWRCDFSGHNSHRRHFLDTFFGQHGTVAYGQLAAFSLLYSIPIIIIYVITESRMGNTSLLAGAVKG